MRVRELVFSLVVAAACACAPCARADWRVTRAGGGDFSGADETPLQAALGAAKAAGGGVVWVGPGVYRINRSLVFDGLRRVTLRGEAGAVLQLKPALATELAEAAPAGARTLTVLSPTEVRTGVRLRILAPGERVAFTGKPRPNFTAWVAGVSNATVTLCEPLAYPAAAGTRVLDDADPNLIVVRGGCADVCIERLALDGCLSPAGLRQPAHNTRCGVWVEGAYTYEKGPLGPKPCRIAVRDCRIRNFHGRGVAIYSGEDCAVERCTIENVLDEGVDLDHFATRCRAVGNIVRNAPVGVELNDANDCEVARNAIEACGVGIRVWRWCRQPELNVRNVIAGNRLVAISGRAVELQAGTSANTVTGNTASVQPEAIRCCEGLFADAGEGNRMFGNAVVPQAAARR